MDWLTIQLMNLELPPLAWSLETCKGVRGSIMRVTSTCVEPSPNVIADTGITTELPPLAWSLARFRRFFYFPIRVTSTCVEPRDFTLFSIELFKSYLHLRGA